MDPSRGNGGFKSWDMLSPSTMGVVELKHRARLGIEVVQGHGTSHRASSAECLAARLNMILCFWISLVTMCCCKERPNVRGWLRSREIHSRTSTEYVADRGRDLERRQRFRHKIQNSTTTSPLRQLHAIFTFIL